MTGIDNSTYIRRLKERLRQKPDSALFLSLAEELRKRDRIDEAITLLVEGVKKNPCFVAAQLTLGRWYRLNNMPAEARRELSAAAEKAPDNIFVHKELAETCRQLGDTGQAAEAYRKVLSLDSFDAEASAFLDGLGALAVSTEPNKSTVEPEAQPALKSEAAEVPEETGNSEQHRAAVPPSLAEVLTAVRPSEGRSSALLQQAEELIAAGEYGRAIEIYNALLKSEPHHSPVRQRKEELKAFMKLAGIDSAPVVARLEKLLVLTRQHFAEQRDRERAATLGHLNDFLGAINSRFARTP
ncbi:MAG: tetratricopeptide repeat protein [Nitrospirota bacterium]